MTAGTFPDLIYGYSCVGLRCLSNCWLSRWHALARPVQELMDHNRGAVDPA